MGNSDPLTHEIIGAATDVSKELGNGLVESVYQTCLIYALRARQLRVARHPTLPVVFGGKIMKQAFKPDLIVEECVVVEVKAVSTILPVHHAQILNYMRLAKINKGLLINFHAFPFKDGIKRFVF